MTFLCQFCSINPSQPFLTKCCKLFLCEHCKIKQQTTSLQCVCLKPIINKKLCAQNQLLHQIICDYENKKQKQCDRCTQPAKILCKNCSMVFCRQCQQDLHNTIGYSKHVREPYFESAKPLNEIINFSKNRPKICETHKQLIEFVCECSGLLCTHCPKSHKQQCPKFPLKPKSLSQYRNQFYSTLLNKLSQITNYKQYVQSQINEYNNYFKKQKEGYDMTSKAIQQQFLTLKKMLQIKTEETQNKLNEYWRECQKVYNKTLFYLQSNLRKYDDYAKLIEKFAENQIGLDYIEKRVKKMPTLNYNSFSFKTNFVEEVKNSILNINSSMKPWDYQFHETIILNLDDTQQEKRPVSSIMKKSDFISGQTPTQMLYEISQNPLNPRHLQFNSSHNEIQFTFLHLPYHTYKYEIEYGVGFKMKGKEVFKKIENHSGRGMIQGLNPSTKYRIRMRVADGQFGEISEVTTLDSPKFYIEPGNIMKLTGQNSFQFLKQGVIYGTNAIMFGVHYWTVILNSQKSAYDQSQTACITVGVSNKEQKKPQFVGSTFNYGYQRDQIVVKLTVNCQEQTVTISASHNNQSEEKFSIMTGFPVFPAIQNKSSATIHIRYIFGKDQA